jgi:hypothetical protein
MGAIHRTSRRFEESRTVHFISMTVATGSPGIGTARRPFPPRRLEWGSPEPRSETPSNISTRSLALRESAEFRWQGLAQICSRPIELRENQLKNRQGFQGGRIRDLRRLIVERLKISAMKPPEKEQKEQRVPRSRSERCGGQKCEWQYCDGQASTTARFLDRILRALRCRGLNSRM